MSKSVVIGRSVLAAAAVLGLLWSADARAQKGAKKTDSVVKATAKADKPDAGGKQVITVTLKIEPSWHTYANKLPEDFPGLPTAVSVEAKTKPESVKVDYPPGKAVRDKTLKLDYHVYEEKADIKVVGQRSKGDT